MNDASLGDVADFQNGRSFKPSEWGQKGLPIIRIQNLTGTSKEFNFFDGSVDDRIRVERGDILISWSASLGVFIWDGPTAALNQHIFKVNLRENVDRQYFYYAATGALAAMAAQVHGSTMQHITKDRFESLRIPLPTTSEQQRVANMLAEVDRLRRMRRYALDISEGLLGAVFLEMFGSGNVGSPIAVEQCLADQKGAIRTGPFGSQLLHSEFTSSGVAVLGIDNAVNNRFQWDVRRYISPQKYAQLKQYTVHPGDVLITIMGTCGRCAIVPDNIALAINSKHLCAITLDTRRCLPEFLHSAFLYSPDIRRQLSAATKGAIMEGLNMQLIRELKISLPPLVQQESFIQVADKIEHSRRMAQEAVRQAEHLFQAMLHEAFGELA